MARSGRQIVGIVVQDGKSSAPRDLYAKKGTRETPADDIATAFTRLGLMTIWDTQLGDRTILPDNITRLRWDEMEIGNILWQDDGLRFFDVPYCQ